MGYSYEQAKAWGIGHLHPDHPGNRRQDSITDTERPRHAIQIARSTQTASRVPVKRTPGARSKLELQFGEMLRSSQSAGLVRRWWHEPMKIRLAGTTFYTPDFLVMPEWARDPLPIDFDGRLTFVETKGPFAREDSIVKLKCAAAMYPCFRWLLVRREGRHGWDVREVGAGGIGRAAIGVEWIRGGL
jgi:hypothetical protein